MISLNSLEIRFGARLLFEDVGLRIGGKDRVAIVGSNGTGKSTLFKIIAGIIEPDDGNVVVSKHTTIGYLPQEGISVSGNTLYDEVYGSAGDINKLKDEIEQAEFEMDRFEDKEADEYFDLLNEYGELHERFEMLEGFKLKSRIEKILTGLGFSQDDFIRDTSEFSGGWQMRIEIGKLLLRNPSILLLDEPTNHLDIESLIWFENYIINYNGACIIISHDRNFLNNVTKRTLEISFGKVTEYKGNYAYYVKEKEIRKQQLLSEYANQQDYIKNQEKFIERFRYKSTKAKAVQSRIKMLDRMELIEIEDDEASVNFHFPPAVHSGRITLEIENLTKSYDGEYNVLEGIDLTLNRGEKIAIVGVNGAGKSTLSRIIAGIEPYKKGKINFGYNVKTKYFAQNQSEELNVEKTVLEILEESSTGEVRSNLRTLLGGFLFRGDDVFKSVSVLSGGEKSRLALAKMLIEPSNFLILDEPTNHLDMKSKDVLVRALQKYEGTVLVVSHDREFLDSIVTKVIEVKNKNIKTYIGNCTEYLRKKETENLITDNTANNQTNGNQETDQNDYVKRRALIKEIKKQLSPLKKNIKAIEEKISKNEMRKKELEDMMSKPDFYRNAELSKSIQKEYGEITDELKNLSAQWEIKSNELFEFEKKLNSK